MVLLASSHFMIGPIAAVLVVGLLALTSRWAFRPRRRGVAPPRRSAPRDYGLLVPVVTTADRDAAWRLRDVLAAHGIRATLGPAGPEPRAAWDLAGPAPRRALSVLVFPDDLDRARQLVGSR